MSRAELETMQLEKFRNLVQHAWQKSPYYRRLITDNGIDIEQCSPADFPVLTKPDLIEHFDSIVTDPRINKKVLAHFLTESSIPTDLLFDEFHVTHTSGSSGQIGYYVFSNEDWGRGIAQLQRQRKGAGSGGIFRRFRIAYFGATRGHFGGVSMISTSQTGAFGLRYKLSLNDVNDPLMETIRKLNEFQPDLLTGYTTALKILAEKQLNGELQIAPSTIISSGEAQSSSDRELFSRAFGCQVGNGYGCTEHLMMGFSNPDGKTMVLYDDDLIYDIYNDHTIITNLFNFTLPLIRYRMSDILHPAEDQTTAEPYLLVNNLIGRSEIVPTFINRDGSEDFISPFTIIELFIPGVSRFQMRLTGESEFDFAICLEPGLNPAGREAAIEATRKRLQDMLAQKLMDNVKFTIVVEEDLPVNERNGKFQLIVQAKPATSSKEPDMAVNS